MNKTDYQLTNLIKEYNQDNELNKLKDILDYLLKNHIYIPSTIKISPKKLITIPSVDIYMILDILNQFNDENYLPVYTLEIVEQQKYPQYVRLSIFDCFNLMKRLPNKTQIMINPKLESSLLLNDSLIAYLKTYK